MTKSFTTEQLNQINPYLSYKLLSGTIIPRPIAWVTTMNTQGVTNAAPFSFFNVVSGMPPLISISMLGQKDTVDNLLSTKEAVIHLVDSKLVEAMNQTAANLPSNISELDYFQIPTHQSQTVAVPTISNALASFEAKLFKHIPLESADGYLASHLMILEITRLSFADDVLDEGNFYIDPTQLDPIARLSGNTYGKLGELFDIQRPQ